MILLVGGDGEPERRLRDTWVVQVETQGVHRRLAQAAEVGRTGRGGRQGESAGTQEDFLNT